MQIYDIKQQLRQGTITLKVLSLIMVRNKNVLVKVDTLTEKYYKVLWIKKKHAQKYPKYTALSHVMLIISTKLHLNHVLDSDRCSKHYVKSEGINFSIKGFNKMQTSDNFWFCSRVSLYVCFTNQKTFTLILTWSSNKTSGNGMAERQQHGKHLIAYCVAPWKHLTWV